MKEVFKNDGTSKAIIKGQTIMIINKDNIIAESYFGATGITVDPNGDLDIVYPDTFAHPAVTAHAQSSWDLTASSVEEFKKRVAKAASDTYEEEEETYIDDDEVCENQKNNYNYRGELEETEADDLPTECVETPYTKVITLIEDFIKEYEDCSEIPTHSDDLYNTDGYNGVYFNSKIAHAPYHFRLMVENGPMANTIYMCFDPRKQHGVYKATTQHIGGCDNGAYTCRLTFSTASSYKRLLAPGDISGWDIHNKDISDLLKGVKEVFDISEIERDAFGGKEYSI